MENTDERSGIRCNEHPDAPHSFMRDASHSAGRYVCECESWEPPKNKPMTRDEWKEWLAESWAEAQVRASTPEQKPVAYVTEWVGLKEQDIHDAFQFTELIKQLDFYRDRQAWCEAFAACIEAKLKEKNGG